MVGGGLGGGGGGGGGGVVAVEWDQRGEVSASGYRQERHVRLFCISCARRSICNCGAGSTAHFVEF